MEVKFFRSATGRSPVEDFLDGCSPDLQAKFTGVITRLCRGETLAMPLSRPLFPIHRGLHELRLRDEGGIYRFLYYVKVRGAIYIVHAFKKTTQIIPRKELELVKRRLKEI